MARWQIEFGHFSQSAQFPTQLIVAAAWGASRKVPIFNTQFAPISQKMFAHFPKRCQLSAQPEIRFLPDIFRKHFAKCRQCSTRPLANRAWTLSAKCPISTQPNMPQLTNGLWVQVARCAILNATQYVAMCTQIADTFRNLSKPRHLPR